ncbi:HYR domain-containing protein [Corallococcus caeni]|uniref:HYR domain-containing protein n=1 Tax=Corallococcus caeni TaxID=3082388 RepID=A0ABQ6QY53_9BACT|nr:hypothetical protein ASNO1_51930 [Corallococcus sp. NO1]
MASCHRSRSHWSLLNPSGAAALLGCLVLLFASCAPTHEDPAQAPVADAAQVDSPPVKLSPPFDPLAVMRRVNQSFRVDSGGYKGRQQHYAVQVEQEGSIAFSARHQPEGQTAPVVGGSLRMRTASVSRAGKSLLRAARSEVREDGTLALDRGGVVEVLQNGDAGLEQRWELAARPEGAGDLEVRVELTGLDYLGETGPGHHFVDRQTGLGVRYGRATWVDADGVRTAVETACEGQSLVMRVPARTLERSAYPAVLDPIISPELSPDEPVPAPIPGRDSNPVVAAGKDVYLVVWGFGADVDLDVIGTRVRISDGAVLDLMGIPLAVAPGKQSGTAVASSGNDFLVVWDDASLSVRALRAARVSGSTGQILGSPFAVSNSTAGQIWPAVAFDGTHYLVAWTDYRGRVDTDIYGARVRASDGALLDPAGILICSVAGYQASPAVAFDGNRFLVVWQDSRSVAPGLHGARVGVDGVVIDRTSLPISTTAGAKFSPAVSAVSGTFLVTWINVQNSQREIQATRVRTSDGMVLEPSGLKLGTATAYDTDAGASVASNGSDFLVVWEDGFGSDNRIRMRRVLKDGSLPEPQGLTLAYSEAHKQVPVVAFDGTRFMVVWSSERFGQQDIHGVRLRASDLVVLDDPPRLLSVRPNTEGSPAVAAGANSYLVVWHDDRDWQGTYDIMGVRVRASDGAVLDAVAIPIATGLNIKRAPSVSYSDGGFLVVWYDNPSIPRTSHTDIHGARIRESDGAVLDSTPIVISAALGSQVYPKVASGAGVHLVTWTDYRNGKELVSDVYAARVRASDGVVLDPDGIPVAKDSHTEAEPAVAYGAGYFLVAWTDSRNGSANPDVYAARVRPEDGTVVDSPALPITTQAELQRAPAVAFDGTSFLTVWYEQRSGVPSEILGTRVRPEDGALLDGAGRAFFPANVSKGPPVVAFDGQAYLLVWRENGPSAFQLMGGRLWPDLSPLDGERFLISDIPMSVSSTTTPAVASWGQGRFLVVYEPYDAATRRLRLKMRLVSDPVNGAKCATDPDCVSGYCVAGVCCASSCPGGTCGGGTCVPEASITCPADVVAEAIGAQGAPVSYPPASAMGASPLAVTYSHASGSVFALGATPITASLTDGLGRAASCGFSVSVRDTTVPGLTCPEQVVAEATGRDGARVSLPALVATDAVTDAPVLVMEPASGSLFPLGTTVVSVTATDAAGNAATCTFPVRVQDTTPPALVCPADLAVEATSLTGATVTYPAATASDAVSDVTVGYGRASGSHFDVGRTRVEVSAADAAGNTASCSFFVVVSLPPPPTITCPADVVAEAQGASGAPVSYPPASAMGASPLAVTYSHASGSVFALGATPITASLTDGLGRAASCGFSVSVRDTTVPGLTCPEQVVAEATGRDGAPVSLPALVATDAVTDAPVLVMEPASGSLFQLGTTVVSVTATDEAGNAATCTFPVRVQDTTPPALVCPADLAVEATSLTGATVTYPASTASDTVSDVTVGYGRASGSHFDVGRTRVEVSASDAASNTASCSFFVVVSLPPPPSITCPADVVAEAVDAQGAAVAYPPATATGRGPLAMGYSWQPGQDFPLGTTSVTATVTDGLGRASTCAFSVTVRDTLAPALTCPSDVVAEAQDASGASVAFPAPVATDAVTAAPRVTSSRTSGSLFPLGATEVSVTATDEAGNAESCAFTLTIQDTTPPTLECPPPVQKADAPLEGLAVDYPEATALDAVSQSTLHYSHGTGTVFPVGTTQVTVQATDAAGNSATCTFPVSVSARVQAPPEPPPSSGCGCGASTTSGLSWVGLMALAWGVKRRRR